jgi:hypothetical protein
MRDKIGNIEQLGSCGEEFLSVWVGVIFKNGFG